MIENKTNEINIEDYKIDVNLNMKFDSDNKDPDTYSKTLNHYHWLLWNKKLPNGLKPNMKKIGRKRFLLELSSDEQKYTLSSDSIIHSYSKWKKMLDIIKQINKEDLENFISIGSTIGGYIIFPSKRIDELPTINGIRGMNPLISDRFDFTLECIKRYYKNQDSPLYEHLKRYSDYFNLFINFKGYIDFFLLNDLVDKEYNIKFWLPFEDFEITSPLPKSVEEYKVYMDNVLSFVNNRNKRISRYNELLLIQQRLHQLIIRRATNFKLDHFLNLEDKELPTIDDILDSETDDLFEAKWFPIPGMYGGFAYRLMPGKDIITLEASSWSRVCGGSGEKHHVTSVETKLIEKGF